MAGPGAARERVSMKGGGGKPGGLAGLMEGAARLLAGALRWSVGAIGGILSFIGGLILLFGAYMLLSGGGIELALLGTAAICAGELMVFLKGLTRKERELLEERIIGTLLRNMAFPLLWLAAYYLLGMDFLLAFAISSGVRAIIENVRITASFYIPI